MNNLSPFLYQSLRTVVHGCRLVSSDVPKYLWLTFTGKMLKIPLQLVTDEFAFSLAADGWNFYGALLAEYEKRPDAALETTTFFRFFQHEQIGAVCYLDDVLFLHRPEQRWRQDGGKFYLGTYPWGGLTKGDSLVGGVPFGYHYDRLEGKMTKDLWGYGRNLWYEPSDRYTLEVEQELTIQLYHALKQRYCPLRYRSFPSVTLLMRRNGDRRALIVDGHHRLAVLSYLGYEWSTVELMQVVKETEVEQWYYVRSGHCTREQALRIFHAFFVLNGSERVAYLNLHG